MAWEEVLYTLAGVIIYFVIPPLIVLLVILKKKKRKKAESAKKNEPKSVVNEPQKVVNAKKEENKIEPIVNPSELYKLNEKLIDSFNSGFVSLQDVEFDENIGLQNQSSVSEEEIEEILDILCNVDENIGLQNQSSVSKEEILDILRNGYVPAQDAAKTLLSEESRRIFVQGLESKISAIKSICFNRNEECHELLQKSRDEAARIKNKICESLDELVLNAAPRNSTLETLLSVYKSVKPSITSSKFQDALNKCAEENVAEVKALIEMNEELKRLKDVEYVQDGAMFELSEARRSIVRSAWKYKYCEQVFNALAAIKSDPSYVAAKNELSKIKQQELKLQEEKMIALSKVERFAKKYVLCKVGGADRAIGRDGNEFAIWYTDGIIDAIRPIDDILYYTITEETLTWSTLTYSDLPTRQRKPSKLGVAIDEAVWGTAAAVVNAMEKQQQPQPQVAPKSYTKKTLTMYFENSSKLSPLTVVDYIGGPFSSTGSRSPVDMLVEMFPEKDVRVASQFAQQTVAPTTANESGNQTAQPNNIQMLREYKKLLDEGIISQEEFDAQKAKLLG